MAANWAPEAVGVSSLDGLDGPTCGVISSLGHPLPHRQRDLQLVS